MENKDDHVISDREKEAWQLSKSRGNSHERPKLDRLKRIRFLELVAQMVGKSVFERELGLSPQDIEFYKKELDVESSDDARRLARKLRAQTDEQREANVIEQTKKAREAEAVAQQRLEELSNARTENEKPPVDGNAIRAEDAERQRRFAAEQSLVTIPEKIWTLPIIAEAGSEQDQIDRFRKDIIYHGLGFLNKKYNVSPRQIRFEAERLGFKINWETVRR